MTTRLICNHCRKELETIERVVRDGVRQVQATVHDPDCLRSFEGLLEAGRQHDSDLDSRVREFQALCTDFRQ